MSQVTENGKSGLNPSPLDMESKTFKLRRRDNDGYHEGRIGEVERCWSKHPRFPVSGSCASSIQMIAKILYCLFEA